MTVETSRKQPLSPEWLELTLKRLAFVQEGTIKVVETDRGYCCLAHEIEFGPVELDLVRVSMPALPGMDERLGRLIYKVLVQEARSAGRHRVVHMEMNADGFQLALSPVDKGCESKQQGSASS